jgi:hypothetical protein
MSNNPLSNIPVITKAILNAQPLHFHAQKLDELQVLRLMADKMHANVELKNDITEAQLMIYRNAGSRFGELFKRGGDGSNQYGSGGAKHTGVRLADYGINNRVADICRKLIALPEQLFDDLILGVREKEHITQNELTVSYMYKAARIHVMRSNGRSTDKPHKPDTMLTLDYSDISAMAQKLCTVLDVTQIDMLIDKLKG